MKPTNTASHQTQVRGRTGHHPRKTFEQSEEMWLPVENPEGEAVRVQPIQPVAATGNPHDDRISLLDADRPASPAP